MPDKEKQESSQNKEETQDENKDNGEKETPRDSKDGKGTPRDKDGKKEQKDYFKEELKRLKNNLEKEASKIETPPEEEFHPYVFNSLKPYFDTHSPDYLITTPEDMQHGYVSRQTAIGLIDPWKDHEMDVTLLPRVDSKPAPDKPAEKKKNDKDRPPKEGSTRLPKYPMVNMPEGDYATKKLYFSDVPMLREELRNKYSDNAETKINKEYKRTKQDFYRMELDRMDEYHPISRPSMRAAYFAYLTNNPGSKKAIHECVKAAEGKAN